jgi:hypothetical protein
MWSVAKDRRQVFRRLIVVGIFAACVLGEVACVQHASSASQDAQRAVQKRYFPTSEFADLKYDSIFIPMFEKHLADLDEPVLYSRPGVHYAVRVTWLTPFYGDAVLRIEDTGEYINFIYKRRPSIAAPDTKKNIDLHGELSREEFARLTSEIQRESFFSLTNKQNVVATDGTIWLLEVYDGDKYHAVYRIGPFSTPVQNIGRLAASLANINNRQLE